MGMAAGGVTLALHEMGDWGLQCQPMKRAIRPEQIEVVDDQIAAILRRKGGAASVEMIASAWRMMRDILDAQIRAKHPAWSAEAVTAEVHRRLINGST